MFTGLIEHTGIVEDIDSSGFIKVNIKNLSETHAGDSISINGACLTLVSINKSTYTFELSPETIKTTGFGIIRPYDMVNVELPKRLSDRLHGHLVQGHIDTTADIINIKESGKHHSFTFALKRISPYLVDKGFIAIDGISVTPYNVSGTMFTIAVIPYTYEHTNLNKRHVKERVNIEFDVIAKYIDSILNIKKRSKITEDFLKERGFA